VIYGPFLNQTIKDMSKENIMVELTHFAPLLFIKKEYLLIEVKSLSLPFDFIQRNNRKIFLQVRLTQWNNCKMNPLKQFHVDSEYLFLNLSDEYINSYEQSIDIAIPL
jgi:hypothetical protein